MTFSNKGRGRLLITVGTAMAASLATSTYAADTLVTSTGATTVNAHDIIDAVLTNTDPVLAQVNNTTGGIEQDLVSEGDETNFTVDGNDILASAIGNNFVNTIDQSIIDDNTNNGGDGAAALGVASNTGVVSSEVLTNTISIDLDDLDTVGITASDNSIVANATANAGSTTIAGNMPLGYAGTTQGSSLVTTGATALDAEGGLTASTLQYSAAPTGSATASGNSITLDLVSPAADTLNSAPDLDDNTIAASVKGNSSNSTIDIQSGSPSTFVGTAVVTNAQLNSADLTGTNADSTIVATIAAAGAAVNSLNGGLSVQGNTISSAASGNEALGGSVAGNRIVIADQVSVDGLAGTTASADTDYAALGVTSTVTADLVIHNSQGNLGTGNADVDRVAVAATTTSADIGSFTDGINGGSVTVAGNDVTSSARGNTASSAFATGDGIASFAATVAVANQQTDTYANISANVSGATISATVNPLANVEAPVLSTVDVNDNTSAASAFGNQVSQSVSLGAVELALPSVRTILTGGTGPDGNVDAEGGAIVTSLQSLYSADATATEDSDIFIRTIYVPAANGGTQGAGLTVDGNTQEAVVVGNSGGNSLSLETTVIDEGVAFGAGAGIASVQIVADDSDLTATSTSTASIGVSEMQNSTAEVTDNLQRAVAYGGLVGNALDLDFQNLTVEADVNGTASTVTYNAAATDGFVFDFTSAPTVNAAFGVLSIQSTSADIAATAGSNRAFSVTLGAAAGIADLEGSSIANDRNVLAAAAYGNDGANSAALDVGNLDSETGNHVAVLNVTNAQTVADGSTVTARATGDETVYTFVADQVVNSEISASDNTVQAVAYGNRADNGSVPGAANQITVDANSIVTEADPVLTPGEASVSTTNVAITDAAFGLNNAQSSDATIVASLRDSDTVPTTSAGIYTDVGGTNTFGVNASEVVSNGNTLSASGNGNRAENGVDIDSNTLATTAALTNFQISEGNISALIGIAGTPNEGGVIINVENDTNASELSVEDNAIAGSVTANSASNQLSVAGNAVSEGADYTTSGATANALLGVNTTATADFALANRQNTSTGTLTSAVFGTFAIDMVNAEDITGSTLAVDGNSQSARSIANTAANGIAIDANNLTAGSALVSNQSSTAAVAATSDVDIFAPAGMLNSSVSLSDNSNTALAVINNATNTTTVSSNNADQVGPAANALLSAGLLAGYDADGDHVLVNLQVAATSATATAVTSIFNDDTGAVTDAIDASSVTIEGNSTAAEASANRSVNTMVLDAGASLDASGGVQNAQSNTGAVTASATTDATVGFSATPIALNAGSVVIDDNSTSAVARGNVANNSLAVSAGSNYGVPSADATVLLDVSILGATSVSAKNAVLNLQFNDGAINASSTGADYTVVLNGTTDTALNSTISVGGNTVSAAAYGNTATNTLTLASVNTGMPTAAIGNRQANTAGVTASVTTVTYGIGPSVGAITGSSLSVSGNAITATAVGNNSINTIGAAN